ncbi:MAG: hypothetical protein AUI14_00135 [Actinobacteria bacterium 13_2_20CM_2_71_6]|nr:MAG: hypothetical protein AUI14_00135 [Actinobacteria bacterium 13_2_20CM_2_71_6]
MRRGQVVALIAVTSGLLTVLLGVAVNVATGGTLPGPLGSVSWLAWPVVGVLAAVGVGLAIWQQRLTEPQATAINIEPGRPPAELPAAPAFFAGRADDRTAIDELLDGGCPVLAMVGPPGAGKSTLALRVAHDRRHRYPDGQLFAALRGADASPVPPETVLVRFLGALGVPGDERRGAVDELAARYRSALAERNVLIVLDDARDAGQVQPLLPGGPGCLVLVTSRRLLAELPHAVTHVLGGLDATDARALLAGSAGAARIAGDPDGAARIVELCGGLPLAVRIAGARLRARPGWTPTDLAARLADERRRLDELRLGDLAVRSSFATSYQELSTVDRLVFRRAGSHPGQVFGVGAATALAGLDEPAVAAALERLVDAQVVESPVPDRYRLHDLLRLFATERLAAEEPAERDACLRRLLDWLASAARAGDWFARERDNVLAAVRKGVESGAYQQVWTLVTTVHPLLTDAGDHPDRLALWSAGADAATALGDDLRRARALYWIANSYRAAGTVTRALAPAVEAVAIAERLGDPATQVDSLCVYGETLRDLSRFEESGAALNRALELVVELGDVDQEVGVRSALGTLYLVAWRPELAVPILEPAVQLLPSARQHRHAWVLNGLSGAYRNTGRHDEATALNERALEMAGRVGDDSARGYAILARAWYAHRDGRFAEATRDAREALAVFERIRHGIGIGGAHEALGKAASGAGRHDEALRELELAAARFERLHDRVRGGCSRLYRAEALASAGRPDAARAEWAAGERLIGDVPVPEARASRERLRERLGDP